MGAEETETQPKSGKASSPVQEKNNNVHAYPNWAAIQAYYGPGVTLPHPYFNSAVPSGHPPHAYMWGTPQPMMSPYGTPYAAIYPHGGVYGHPSLSLGSHGQGHGSSSSPPVSEAMAATPLSIATPAKSSSNKDQGFMKKLKGLNGLPVSIGNGTSGSSAASQSGDCRTEGSSDGNTSEGGGQTQRKRSSKVMPSTGEASATSSMSLGVNLVPAGVADGAVGTPPPNAKARMVTATFPAPTGAEVPPQDGLTSGLWIKDERELKRERRKQSNRESARRSRLKKQAETEELALKVEALNAENQALKSEIIQLKESSEKLRLENAELVEKLKGGEVESAEEMVSNGKEGQETKPFSTENFLSRVDSSLSNTMGGAQMESETPEKKSGTKLHQLLESSPRTDAVAAG